MFLLLPSQWHFCTSTNIPIIEILTSKSNSKLSCIPIILSSKANILSSSVYSELLHTYHRSRKMVGEMKYNTGKVTGNEWSYKDSVPIPKERINRRKLFIQNRQSLKKFRRPFLPIWSQTLWKKKHKLDMPFSMVHISC